MSILYSRSSCSHHVKLSYTFAPNISAVLRRAILNGYSETVKAEIFGANVEDSSPQCEPKDLEYRTNCS